MKVPFVDLHAQYLTIKPEIDDAIASVISESAYIRGKHVEAFEDNWAKMVGVKNCISCASGTDALFIGMKALCLGLKPGYEVITTAHSWIATSSTITQAGGKVTFCDTETRSFNIDPGLIEDCITSRTVGIVVVHLYGQPADMDRIMKIAEKHNLWVIEDCAQAHLATYKGQNVGTFGNLATFSFYPGKNLGAYGDAGCIVTNNLNIAVYCGTFAQHGAKGAHIMEGINSRMDGLQAAILNVKMPHLLKWTHKRQLIAENYNIKLTGVVTPTWQPQRTHACHLYVIRTESRNELRDKLNKAGVSTAIHYSKALPFYPAYTHLGYKPEDFPRACANVEQILSLPIYPEITEEQIEYVVEVINQ